MNNRLGGDHIALIVMSISALLIVALLTWNWRDTREMQMQAFEKCLQNNIDLTEKSKSTFPISNHCRL